MAARRTLASVVARLETGAGAHRLPSSITGLTIRAPAQFNTKRDWYVAPLTQDAAAPGAAAPRVCEPRADCGRGAERAGEPAGALRYASTLTQRTCPRVRSCGATSPPPTLSRSCSPWRALRARLHSSTDWLRRRVPHPARRAACACARAPSRATPCAAPPGPLRGAGGASSRPRPFACGCRRPRPP